MLSSFLLANSLTIKRITLQAFCTEATPLHSSNAVLVYNPLPPKQACTRGQGNRQVAVFLCTYKWEFSLLWGSVSAKSSAKAFHVIWLQSKKRQTFHCKPCFPAQVCMQKRSKQLQEKSDFALMLTEVHHLLASKGDLQSKTYWN